MATSSITANFYCDDAKAANAFVRMLAQPVRTVVRKKRSQTVVNDTTVDEAIQGKVVSFKESPRMRKLSVWRIDKFAKTVGEADRAKLLEFYNANGFKSWNGRYDKKDQVQYDQMIRVLESVA